MDFSSVSVVRPYEQIVKQIQQAIRDGQLPSGTQLPTERELSEQFGVSRSVVREAIKVLNTMGLVESRQGIGSFVRHGTIESISRAFVMSVSPNAESVEKLFEFRQLLEVQAVRLAAIRRTDDQAARIREAAFLIPIPIESENWDVFGVSDLLLHEAIAEASGNPYLQIAVATSREMLQDLVRLFVEKKGSIDVAIDHHHRIAEAIAHHDSDLAAKEMAKHIEYTAEIIQSQLARELPPIPEANPTTSS